VGNPYLFTGRRYDPETGLYYYRARYYDPEIGRFLQVDPIGYAGGINLYGYCQNNPILFIDPWGLCKEGSGYSWGDFAIDAASAVLVVGDIVLGGPTGEGIGPAAGLQGLKGGLRHAKSIKRIVQSASKPGVKLGPKKLKQLERVVTKAGGRLRTEVGVKGSMRGVRHSHVEGFGSKTAHRHIIHLGQ